MSTPAAVDPQALADLRALNPEDAGFLRELIELFLQDVPQRIRDIDQALATQDAVLLTRAAHTIKGSCSNFGAASLARVAQQIELQGKTGNLAAVPPALESLRAEFALVTEALKRFV